MIPACNSLWREIWGNNEKFWQNICFIPRNGQRIQFWVDTWAAEHNLVSLFPQLLPVCTMEGWVNDFKSLDVEFGTWNLQLRRALFHREIQQTGKVLKLVENSKIAEEEDRIRWKGRKDGLP